MLERTDAVLKSSAFGRLQWPTEGSICRLPAGGPSGCSSYCCDSFEDDLPVHSQRLKRPMYVVFDQTDPISALERSFDLAAGRKTQSTQTVFMETKSTQTEQSSTQDEATQFEPTPSQPTDSKPTPVPVKKEEKSSADTSKLNKNEVDSKKTIPKQEKAPGSSPYYAESKEDLTNKKAKPKKEKAHTDSSYYAESREDLVNKKPKQKAVSNAVAFTAKPTNILQKIHFWKRNLVQDSNAEPLHTADPKETPKFRLQYTDAPRDTADCRNCRIVPDISRKLSELLLKLDRQEAQVRQLQYEVRRIKSNNAKGEQAAPPNQMRDTDIRTAKLFMPTKSSSSFQMLNACSSECHLCSGNMLPVLDDLIAEVLELIGPRKFADIVLTLQLRADNVYHVNAQERYSKRNLGCVLVTPEAIRVAIKRGFFNQILTYTVSNVRSTDTSTSTTNTPFGVQNSFMPGEETFQNDDEATNSTGNRISEFITKVLGIPADKI